MTTEFTKGGILNSSQLEDISGKRWKKGGILSATQLNELSGGSEEESYPYGIRVTESHPFTIINDTRKESLDKLLWFNGPAMGQNLSTGTLNRICPYDSEGPSSIEVTDHLGGYGAPVWFKNGKRGDVDRLFLVVVPEPDTVVKVSSDGGNTFKSAGNLIDGFIDIYGYKENWRPVQITHIKFEKKAA